MYDVVLVAPKMNRRPAEFLGLGYLAAVSRKEGINVKIIDCVCDNMETDEVIKNIKELEAKIVGITITEFSLAEAEKLLNNLKKEGLNIHVTVGGYYPSFNIEYMLNKYNNIDSVQYGEGEKTFVQLAKCIIDNKEWRNTPGIAYVDENGSVKKNEPQEFVEDLDELPLPARDTLIKIKEGARNIPHIYSSRGCHGRCTFCSIHQFYRLMKGNYKWRARNYSNVVDEMEMLNKKYGCDEVVFFDDNFIGPWPEGNTRAKDIAKELIRRNLNMKFSIAARVDNVDYETFHLLKKAGLSHVFLGVESAVQRILNFYGKGVKVEQTINALGILKELEISVEIGFIMFNPFITFEEIKQNYDFLEKIKSDVMITTLNLELEIYKGQKMETFLRNKCMLGEYKDYFFTYKFQDELVYRLYKIIKEKEKWFLDCYCRIKDLKRYTLITDEDLIKKVNVLYTKILDFDFNYFKHSYYCVKNNDLKHFNKFRLEQKECLKQLENETHEIEGLVQNNN